MLWLIVLFLVFSVVIGLLVIRSKPTPNSPPPLVAAADNEPRDFIERANNWFSVPLRELLESNRADVIAKLIHIMETGANMDRKAAAYALGQIGDSDLIQPLESAISRESVKGVREAMEASYVALQKAPADQGHNELARRKIIDDVYYNR